MSSSFQNNCNFMWTLEKITSWRGCKKDDEIFLRRRVIDTCVNMWRHQHYFSFSIQRRKFFRDSFGVWDIFAWSWINKWVISHYVINCYVFHLHCENKTWPAVLSVMLQVKAYLHSERFRLKFCHESVTLRRFWLSCFSRQNFKWNPWLLMLFTIVLAFTIVLDLICASE